MWANPAATASSTVFQTSSLTSAGTARWGFAIYLASKNGYQDSVLPTGHTAGPPEDALDTACGLYLGDPTAWL
ncbi:hypothetical protein [Mycobacterium heckeshornense]|uniref:hypothetical protein n=1 Tax=Mycobacterium heckeshornense TaxID=110505 RepID=UPI000A7713F7|nr:hypothetical protein [Mycobacterium heckeshornense]